MPRTTFFSYYCRFTVNVYFWTANSAVYSKSEAGG